MKTNRTLLVLTMELFACFAANGADPVTASCSERSTSANAYAERSIYQIESKWTNDAGRQIKLDLLKGRPQLIAMFFANCQYACPLIVNDMKRIEAALPEQMRTNLGCTLVSFDTKRDTAAALADYRRARQLTAERWTLLRGNSDDVLELAALLGVRYKQNANGQFSHSNIITVLNAEGEIVHQQVGLSQDIHETVRVIENLLTK